MKNSREDISRKDISRKDFLSTYKKCFNSCKKIEKFFKTLYNYTVILKISNIYIKILKK